VLPARWVISWVAFVAMTSQMSYGLTLTVVTTSGLSRSNY